MIEVVGNQILPGFTGYGKDFGYQSKYERKSLEDFEQGMIKWNFRLHTQTTLFFSKQL